jgi:hypothetical protein
MRAVDSARAPFIFQLPATILRRLAMVFPLADCGQNLKKERDVTVGPRQLQFAERPPDDLRRPRQRRV